jgi:hypothetical protein
LADEIENFSSYGKRVLMLALDIVPLYNSSIGLVSANISSCQGNQRNSGIHIANSLLHDQIYCGQISSIGLGSQ